MSPIEFFSGPFGQRLAFTLLHFFWQGLAVASALVVVANGMGLRRAQSRYLACLAATVVLAACPLVTFVVWDNPAHVSRTAGGGPSQLASWREIDQGHLGKSPWEKHLVSAVSLRATVQHAARAAQPWLVAAWTVGVLVMATRMVVGLVGVCWLTGSGRAVGPGIQACARRLCRRLRLHPDTPVLLSTQVTEATALGFFRPMVLLPAAWVVQLPPEVLEAVIAHELSHIRRWDLWVNLFQRVVEVLLFFHPVVWWLSHRLRVEREMCCDELAVSVTGERLAYVKALERVARQRLTCVRPAYGAGIGDEKMALLNRVRYLLGVGPGKQFNLAWPAGVLASSVLIASWLVGSALSSPVKAQDETGVPSGQVVAPQAVEQGQPEAATTPADENQGSSEEEKGDLRQVVEQLKEMVQNLQREVQELRAATGTQTPEAGNEEPAPEEEKSEAAQEAAPEATEESHEAEEAQPEAADQMPAPEEEQAEAPQEAPAAEEAQPEAAEQDKAAEEEPAQATEETPDAEDEKAEMAEEAPAEEPATEEAAPEAQEESAAQEPAEAEEKPAAEEAAPDTCDPPDATEPESADAAGDDASPPASEESSLASGANAEASGSR